ncbi:MAG TPA: M48 family metallopeptidase [Rectinemataceae bacterium]
MLEKRLKKLYAIDPRSWEHPADKAALGAVRQLKGLDELAKRLISATTERGLRLEVLASNVKVTPAQYPRLNAIMDKVVDTFDWDYRPELFVCQNPVFNAGALGVEKPFITLNSALLRSFDEKELTAIIAHEMGHIMSGHSLYKTLIWFISNLSLSFIPMGELVKSAVWAALMEWNRKSELSSDRAELLAVQEETPSYNILMKMAGADDLSQVNLNAFFEQAQEYESQKTVLDSVHKFFGQMKLSHPYPVVRLGELKTWASSGAYQAILDGDYIKRGFGPAERPTEGTGDLKQGFQYYREEIRKSDDPIVKVINVLGEGIEKAAGSLEDKIREIFKT